MTYHVDVTCYADTQKMMNCSYWISEAKVQLNSACAQMCSLDLVRVRMAEDDQ